MRFLRGNNVHINSTVPEMYWKLKKKKKTFFKIKMIWKKKERKKTLLHASGSSSLFINKSISGCGRDDSFFSSSPGCQILSWNSANLGANNSSRIEPVFPLCCSNAWIISSSEKTPNDLICSNWNTTELDQKLNFKCKEIKFLLLITLTNNSNTILNCKNILIRSLILLFLYI